MYYSLYEYYETGRDYRWSSWLLRCRISQLYLIGRPMIIVMKTSPSVARKVARYRTRAVNIGIEIFDGQFT